MMVFELFLVAMMLVLTQIFAGDTTINVMFYVCALLAILLFGSPLFLLVCA